MRNAVPKIIVFVFLFLFPLCFFHKLLVGGALKSGGVYEISDDALDAAGRPGLAGGAFWMLSAAGQPAGYATMSGGAYSLEGGYVSGVEAVFSLIKTVDLVEAPAGYTGAPNDPVPGARIRNLLSYTNYSEASDPNSALIEDYIPSSATYYTGSITLRGAGKTDALDGDECRYDSGPPARAVCENLNIAAGESATMSFQITIQ